MGRHVPFLKDREVVTSRCHGNKIPGSQETEVLQIWQKKKKKTNKKWHVCSPSCAYLAFIVRQWIWPSLSRSWNSARLAFLQDNDTQYISSVTVVATYVSSPNSSQQRFSRADWRRVNCCTAVMWPLILNLNQYNQSTLISVFLNINMSIQSAIFRSSISYLRRPRLRSQVRSWKMRSIAIRWQGI